MFIVDTMLGSLARWLRVLGFDTLYETGMDDDDIFRLAASENRVIISRDRELCGRRPGSILLRTTDLDEQITLVLKGHPADPDRILSRCLDCNTILQEVPLDRVNGRVPDDIIHRFGMFRHCGTCDKFYWPGSHHDNMMERARQFLQPFS